MEEKCFPENFAVETMNAAAALATYSQLSANFAKIKDKSALDSAKMVGGNVQHNYETNPTAFGNACTIRLCYAFNASNDLIPFVRDKTISGDYDKNGVKEWYYFRVTDMVSNFLNLRYSRIKISALSSIKRKKGIILFGSCTFSDATGHVDLWNGAAVEGKDYSSRCSDLYFYEIK